MKKYAVLLFIVVVISPGFLKKKAPEFIASSDFYPPSLPFILTPGEYTGAVINTSNHKYYGADGGVLEQEISGTNIVGGSGGAHGRCALDDGGNVWCEGDNHTGACGNGSTTDLTVMTKITRDSIGNSFTGIAQVLSTATDDWYTAALKTDGTVWAWGRIIGGIEGNGTYGNTAATRPVQITFPGGVVIKKLAMALSAMALTSDGHLYTWGSALSRSFYPPYLLGQGRSDGPYTWALSPVEISDPEPGVAIIDIAGGGQQNFILLANGHVYASGYYINQFSAGLTGDMGTYGFQFKRLDNIWNLTTDRGAVSVTRLFSTTSATYALTSDSSIFSLGSTASGESGTGIIINWATASPVYAWSQSINDLVQTAPSLVSPGKHDWVWLFDGQALNFYIFAIDASGNIYSWGRDKTGNLLLGNVPAGTDINATYPNLMDEPFPVKTNFIFSPSSGFNTSCPYCVANPGGSPCSEYSIPAVASPTVSASNETVPNTGSFSVTCTPSPTSGTLARVRWTQNSGPTTLRMGVITNSTLVAQNIASGTYSLTATITDNNWRTSSATVSVTVVNATTRPGVTHRRGNRRRY